MGKRGKTWENMGKHGKTRENTGKHGNTYLVSPRLSNSGRLVVKKGHNYVYIVIECP